MTDQPNPPQPENLLDIVESRTDGLSREQIIEYIRELNTIASECEIAGTAELSRAAHNLYRISKQWFKSLPTRDGAEGAGPIGEDTPYWRTLRNTRIAKDLAANCGYELTGDAYATPPKPAFSTLKKVRNRQTWKHLP